MKKLVRGLAAFRENVYSPMSEFFRRLADGQQPRALVITCSDSRVNPDLMLQAEPGELFMIRNAGNLVPPHGVAGGGEAATIEYAVAQLKVRNIVVCGHARCGAMKALANPAGLGHLPAVAAWLKHAEATRRIAEQSTKGLTADEAWEATARANVLVQMENLRTHPEVAAGIVRGDLYLHAWYYDFAAGQLYAHDPIRNKFVSASESPPVAVVPPGFPLDRIPSRPGTPFGALIAEGSQPSPNRANRVSPSRRRAV